MLSIGHRPNARADDRVPLPTLLRLVYTSRATVPLGPMALDGLVADSRRRNEATGITGLLLYHQGHFLQCFEGPPEVVHSTYARICRDPRHRDVTERLLEPIRGRSFGSWYMAYSNVGASTWAMLDGVDWEPSAADDSGPGLSRGFVLLERIWDLYRNTREADRGPPGF